MTVKDLARIEADLELFNKTWEHMRGADVFFKSPSWNYAIDAIDKMGHQTIPSMIAEIERLQALLADKEAPTQ